MKTNKNVIFSTSLAYIESMLFDPCDLPNGQELSDDPSKAELMQAFAEELREGTLIEAIDQWRQDEKMNLDDWHFYLVVYDVGRWDGRYKAYSVLSSLSELLDLDSRVNDSDVTFSVYLKGNSLQGKFVGHDGTTYFKVYQIDINPSSTWDGRDDFLRDAQEGNYLSDRRIRRYCRSAAPVVRRVYGL